MRMFGSDDEAEHRLTNQRLDAGVHGRVVKQNGRTNHGQNEQKYLCADELERKENR